MPWGLTPRSFTLDIVEDEEKHRELSEEQHQLETAALELRQSASDIVSQKHIKAGSEYGFSGLRGTVRGDEHSFTDMMDAILNELGDISEETTMYCGLLKIGSYSAYSKGIRNEGVTNVESKRVSFVVEFPDEYTYTDWSKSCCQIVLDAENGVAECSGLLVDALETEDASEMASHIETQLEEVPKRLEPVLELERVVDRMRGDGERTYEELASSSGCVVPRASGIGEKSIERMIRKFAVPSNILAAGKSEFQECVSTAYGNTPDIDSAYENVLNAVEKFEKFSEAGKINCEYSLEELEKYPEELPMRL